MNQNRVVKVWDLPLRLFHWLLVAAFFLAYFTEEDLMTVHVWAGYTVVGLVLFRIVWGFAGTRYARFSSFLCSPAVTLSYLKDLMSLSAKRYLGHNPAGAAMIVMLLVAVAVTAVTGLIAYAADEGAGPLAGVVTGNGELWEAVHEISANLTLLLVFVHVAGVIFESFLHQENLVKSMVDGDKRVAESAERIVDDLSSEQNA
jgi:cytochrome b